MLCLSRTAPCRTSCTICSQVPPETSFKKRARVTHESASGDLGRSRLVSRSMQRLWGSVKSCKHGTLQAGIICAAQDSTGALSLAWLPTYSVLLLVLVVSYIYIYMHVHTDTYIKAGMGCCFYQRPKPLEPTNPGPGRRLGFSGRLPSSWCRLINGNYRWGVQGM